ncbi:MAG: polyhydroxyalkanoate synthesis repressor PhaR [Alphaproteobacteria bacterium]
MPNSEPGKAPPVIIKKYANRRLYNTATSSYVTLEDLCKMVKHEQDFVVYDAKTGEDITRSVLTQIIVEEEGKGTNLLPIGFLRQLIAYYGDSLQGLVPKYLDHSMTSFAKNQEQMRKYLANAFDGMFPFGSLEDLGKQNMALVEQAMKMFNPMAATQTRKDAPETKDAAPSDDKSNAMAAMQDKIDALQKQIEALVALGTKGKS